VITVPPSPVPCAAACHVDCLSGSCSSGGGKPFYFNTSAEPLDDKHNLLWFHDYT
jgi:hypothetical protein